MSRFTSKKKKSKKKGGVEKRKNSRRLRKKKKKKESDGVDNGISMFENMTLTDEENTDELDELAEPKNENDELSMFSGMSCEDDFGLPPGKRGRRKIREKGMRRRRRGGARRSGDLDLGLDVIPSKVGQYRPPSGVIKSKLFSFLQNHGLSTYFKKMKTDCVEYEDLGIFLEDPKSLEDYIPKRFHRIKFLKALKKEKENKGKSEDQISGEYNWDGKSVQIKENFVYFENYRYEFEKLTSNVYKIKILEDIFVFIWDNEDEMLRVVRTKGEYEFIKRISSVANAYGENLISGEYDWDGKSLDIKKNHVFFERKRYSFEKVASTVYTVQMNEKKFVFHWDNEDTVLGVVEVEGDKFFERIDKKVFVKKIE